MVFIEGMKEYEAIKKTSVHPIVIPNVPYSEMEAQILKIQKNEFKDPREFIGISVMALEGATRNPEFVQYMREQHFDLLITEHFPE